VNKQPNLVILFALHEHHVLSKIHASDGFHGVEANLHTSRKIVC